MTKMRLSDLKTCTIRVSAFDANITLSILPYWSTYLQNRQTEIDAFLEEHAYIANKADDLPIIATLAGYGFFLLESMVVDIEFTNTDNSHIKGLQTYWKDREKRDMKANWEAMSFLVSIPVLQEIYDLCSQSHVSLPGADPIIADGEPDFGTDPEVTGDGGSTSKK